jgi:hypothetical protein
MPIYMNKERMCVMGRKRDAGESVGRDGERKRDEADC